MDSNAPHIRIAEQPRQQIGVCLAKSREARAAFEYVSDQCPSVRVKDQGPYYQFEADGSIRIPLEAVADYLGRSLTMSQFLVCMTTYYGRIVSEDDVFIVTADMAQLDRTGR